MGECHINIRVDKTKKELVKKILLIFLMVALVNAAEEKDIKDCCEECEDYFITNCPIKRGDYNGCCLCTQYYYYGCECCREVVEELGVGHEADCTKWGEPTGDDEFCYMKDAKFLH